MTSFPRTDLQPPAMRWGAWGDPDKAAPLSDGVAGLLSQALGIVGLGAPIADPATIDVPASRLTADDLAALTEIAGAVTTSAADRLAHGGGTSTTDLLRRRAGLTGERYPDAVVAPADAAQTADVIAFCSRAGIAIVPFGGGTGVVGGNEPDAGTHRAVIVVDTREMAGLREFDAISGLATFGAGTFGPAAEAALAEHGFTLGHFPQSYEYATLGGFAAARSAGQASFGYGRFEDMVLRLVVATGRGLLTLGRAARAADGPDLRQLVLGSEGAFGIVCEVTVRVRPIPATTRHLAWRFPDFAAGAAALRTVAQRGLNATVLRLSDEMETGLNLAMGKKVGDAQVAGGALAIATFEGTAAEAEAHAGLVAAVAEAGGGVPLGPEPAEHWQDGRFSAPYLRDSLLDAGGGCETLETATTWANLATAKQRITEAIVAAAAATGTGAVVMCHISHVYPAGASLYFTVVYKMAGDPVAQWASIKRAANDAIAASGAVVSHHHGVGTDHRDWLAADIGEAGVELLAAVKAHLDPAGVLNPGTLLP